jgi:hypothetical protein
MKLLIVIVNWRTAGLTVDCLESLAPQVQAQDGVRVVVTDNASGDDSCQVIGNAIATHGWERWCELLPLERNGGFAYGNNGAIRPALQSDNPPQLIWLLNPDTTARPGAVGAVLDAARDYPQAHIFGTRCENPDGSPRRTAFRFHNPLGEFESMMRLGVVTRLTSRHKHAPPLPDGPAAVDWVSGCSMVVRREVFETIGLLDEGYFMYYEEQDYIRQAKDAGFGCWYLPQAAIVHLVGQASGVTSAGPRKRRPAYWFESRRRYWDKHAGPLGRWAGDAAFVLGLAGYRLNCWVRRRSSHDPPKLMGDFFREGRRGRTTG